MADLDQGGIAFQSARVYLGPSLGWVTTQIRPTISVTLPGTVTIGPGTSVVLVNVAGAVTVQLPDVSAWVREPAYQPATAFDRGIWVKDLGGNAGTFPITVNPFPGQLIDFQGTYSLAVARALARFYPLPDLSGWYIA